MVEEAIKEISVGISRRRNEMKAIKYIWHSIECNSCEEKKFSLMILQKTRNRNSPHLGMLKRIVSIIPSVSVI